MADSEGEQSTPTEIREAADELRRDVIPAHSKEQYDREYEIFCNWRDKKRLGIKVSDNVVEAYYAELTGKYKAWSLFSKMAKLKK